MQRGRDGAYTDLLSMKSLVDEIITPLVHFLT
jgi:hypothetical protein